MTGGILCICSVVFSLDEVKHTPIDRPIQVVKWKPFVNKQRSPYYPSL